MPNVAYKFPYIFLAFSVAYYLVFFGLGRLFDREGYWSVPKEYGLSFQGIHPGVSVLVIAGVVLFVLAFLLAHFFVRPKGGSPAPKGVSSQSKSTALYFAAIGLLLINASLAMFDWRPDVLFQAITNLKYAGIIAIRVVQSDQGLSRKAYFAGAASIALLLIAELLNSLNTPFLLSLSCLVLVELLYSRRKWMFFLVVGAFTLLISPTLRESTPAHIQTHCLPRAEAFVYRVLPELLNLCPDLTTKSRVIVETLEWSLTTATIRRFSSDVYFDRVYRYTPSIVPYWNGETLNPLRYTLMPRLIMPTKPEETLGQEFGHAYRVLYPDDKITSMNVPWIVEFYANFGRSGVALGMLLIGAVLGTLTTLVIRLANHSDISIVMAGVLFPLFYAGSNVSLMFGNAIHGFVGGAVLIFGLEFWRRIKERSAKPNA